MNNSSILASILGPRVGNMPKLEKPIEELGYKECNDIVCLYSLHDVRAASTLNRLNEVSRDPRMNQLQKLVARRDLAHFELVAVDMFLGLVDKGE